MIERGGEADGPRVGDHLIHANGEVQHAVEGFRLRARVTGGQQREPEVGLEQLHQPRQVFGRNGTALPLVILEHDLFIVIAVAAEVYDVWLNFLQSPQQVPGPHGQAVYDLELFTAQAEADALFQVAGLLLQAEVACVRGIGGEVQNFYLVRHGLPLSGGGVHAAGGYSVNWPFGSESSLYWTET